MYNDSLKRNFLFFCHWRHQTSKKIEVCTEIRWKSGEKNVTEVARGPKCFTLPYDCLCAIRIEKITSVLLPYLLWYSSEYTQSSKSTFWGFIIIFFVVTFSLNFKRFDCKKNNVFHELFVSQNHCFWVLKINYTCRRDGIYTLKDYIAVNPDSMQSDLLYTIFLLPKTLCCR